MIDVKMQYQAIVFVNASDIAPTPDTIGMLIATFRDRGFIPSTFQELSPSTGSALELRLRISSPDNEWSIRFGMQRIVIERNPTDLRGSNLGTPREFCPIALDFIERIVNRFNKRANRVALIATYLLEEMTQTQLSETYTRLFRPPEFYQRNPPFEWNWRSVSRIPVELIGISDSINVITGVNRLKGNFGSGTALLPFDRLQLAFDINTSADNSEYRFELSHIRALYDSLIDRHDSVLNEMLRHISG